MERSAAFYSEHGPAYRARNRTLYINCYAPGVMSGLDRSTISACLCARVHAHCYVGQCSKEVGL